MFKTDAENDFNAWFATLQNVLDEDAAGHLLNLIQNNTARIEMLEAVLFNDIRMIRRRYPKGTDFGKVSTAAIKDLEQWINNYPREILGWKTSAMCFRECLDTL